MFKHKYGQFTRKVLDIFNLSHPRPTNCVSAKGSIHTTDSFIGIFIFVLYPFQISSTHLLLTDALGLLRILRFLQSNQKEDLDKSIIYLTESILFPSWPWQVHGTKILRTLYFLALVLVKHSKVNKLPEGAIHAATYIHQSSY